MDAALRVTDKRSFEMNAKRNGAISIIGLCDRLSQILERLQDAFLRRGDGRRQIAGNTVLGHVALEGGERCAVSRHHVVPRAAMDMNVNEPRSQSEAGKIDLARAAGDLDCRARPNGDDAPIFNDHNRRVNPLSRCDKILRGDDSFHALFTFLVLQICTRQIFRLWIPCSVPMLFASVISTGAPGKSCPIQEISGAEWRDLDEVSFAMPLQGVLTKI